MMTAGIVLSDIALGCSGSGNPLMASAFPVKHATILADTRYPVKIPVSGGSLSALGGRIKQARKAARLSQMALGRRAGVNQGTVSAWERGETEPRPAYLLAVAEATGFALEWLRTGEGPMVAPAMPPAPADGGESFLSGFLEHFPGDRLLIVRAVIQGLVTARQPIPAWLTELHNRYLPVTLSADEIERMAAETESRRRGVRPDGDRRAG